MVAIICCSRGTKRLEPCPETKKPSHKWDKLFKGMRPGFLRPNTHDRLRIIELFGVLLCVSCVYLYCSCVDACDTLAMSYGTVFVT